MILSIQIYSYVHTCMPLSICSVVPYGHHVSDRIRPCLKCFWAKFGLEDAGVLLIICYSSTIGTGS